MAPLPTNGTARVFVDYITRTSGGLEHTLQVRYVGPADGGQAAQQAVLNLLTALGPANFNEGWQVLRVRVAPVGSNFSVPVALLPGLDAFVGTDATPLARYQEALEVTFQGRSPLSGRRVDISLYGLTAWSTNFPEDFRVPAAGANWVALAVAALESGVSDNNTFFAIDGTAPIWQPYANLNFNSYWERRLRSA